MKRVFILSCCLFTFVKASDDPERSLLSGYEIEKAIRKDDIETIRRFLEERKKILDPLPFFPEPLPLPEDDFTGGPLYWAARSPGPHSAEIGELLIGAGARCDTFYHEGLAFAPIEFWAAKYGNLDFILMLHRKDPSIINKVGIWLVATRYMFDFFDEKRPYCLIHIATMCGQLKVMEKLCELGADVNAQGYLGQTPLHIAAEHHNIPCTRFLVSHGASLTATDSHKKTPLHTAMDTVPAPELVALLIGDGTPCTMRDDEGHRPIDIKPYHYRSHFLYTKHFPESLELIRTAMQRQQDQTNLVKNGTVPAAAPAPQIQTQTSQSAVGASLTPLHSTAYHMNRLLTCSLIFLIARLNAAEPPLGQSRRATADHYTDRTQRLDAQFREALDSMYFDHSPGHTIIILKTHHAALLFDFAITIGGPEAVKAFLCTLDEYHLTLSNFEDAQFLHRAALVCRLPVIQILLEYGLDPNARDDDGNTPLFRLAWGYKEDVADALRLLIEHGAHLDARNWLGETVWDIAQNRHHETLIAAIKQMRSEMLQSDLPLHGPKRWAPSLTTEGLKSLWVHGLLSIIK